MSTPQQTPADGERHAMTPPNEMGAHVIHIETPPKWKEGLDAWGLNLRGDFENSYLRGDLEKIEARDNFVKSIAAHCARREEALRRERQAFRSALLRVTGSLGLVMKAYNVSAPGHELNYTAAKQLLEATADDNE